MTPEELSAIESRANAATPGPWRLGRGSGNDWATFEADYAFIAEARADVVALIAEVRRLQAGNLETNQFLLQAMEAASRRFGDAEVLRAENVRLQYDIAAANETINDLNTQLVGIVEQAQSEAVVIGDDLSAHPEPIVARLRAENNALRARIESHEAVLRALKT